MATKYGFNITIGANTDPFTTALNKLNKPIQDAQKSIKRLNDGLKLNPTNTDILQSKFEQLGFTVTDLNNKLTALKSARDNLIQEANGNYTEDQYRTLQKLNGEIAVTQEELKQATREYNNFSIAGEKTKALGEAMKTLGSHIENVGKKLAPISALAGGALVGAVKSASDWETAWTGVTKTVSGTDEQMGKLEQDLLNMSKDLGVSKDELAKFAETAGQSGIAVDDITEFTRVISDLNVATNITGEEGARDLARLFNIMKLDNEEVSNFGSALTALGNNFPTTEKEILDLATRMAGTGDVVGLTGQQLLALATTMSSLGSEAEAGGTAMSKIFKKMQLAISTDEEQVKKFADVSRMSVDEFTELFQTNALGALDMFTWGLAKTKEEGGDVIAVLDDMKLSEVRLSDQLLRLASNNELLSEAFDISAQSWEDNYALAEEADKRYGTLTYRFQALKEQVDNIAVSLGNILLPILKNIIAGVQEWITKFENLSPQTKETIVKILLMATVLAPVIILIGKVISGLGVIIGLIPGLISVIGMLFTNVKYVITGIGVILKGLFTLIMAHPVIAVATVIIGALILLYNKCEWFRDIVNKAVSAIWNFIKNVGEKIKTFFTETIPSWIQFVINVFNNLPYYIGYAMGYVLGKIIKFGVDAWNWVTTELPKIIENVVNWFKGLPEKIGNALTNALTKIGEWFNNVGNSVRERLPGIIQDIKDWFTSIDWGEVGWNMIEGLWNGIRNAKDWLWGHIKGFAQGILDGFKDSLDIHSPSKLFEDVIGKNIALGIGEGFDNNISGITKDMVGQINGITSDINVAGGTGTVTLQFYPQQMTEADLEMAFNYVNRRFGTQY